MRLTTLLPHPALRPFVLRYLALEATAPAPLEQYVPPPTGHVLVVLFSGAQRAGVLGGVLEPMPPAYVIGRLDRAGYNELTGSLRSFMVQFTATGAYRLLGTGLREMTNATADLGAVAGADLREWANSLADLPCPASCAAAADQVLLRRLRSSALGSHSRRALDTATLACRLIREASGCLSVDALARLLHTTPRTLLRHFDEVVGTSVRSTMRIERFLAVRTYLDQHPDISWSEVAFHFGYTDQSHLIRDFRRYCAESPSEFRARRNEARLITLVGPESLHASTAR